METGHHHEITDLSASDIGFSHAFTGGFSSFFSVWQFCIAQISPFYIAFIIGAYLIAETDAIKRSVVRLMVISFGYMAGFSIVFALLGLSGADISAYLLYNIRVFRTISGVFIILTSAVMGSIGLNKGIKGVVMASPTLLLYPVAPFLGAAFAFVYSPCIPPVLSHLLNYASMPENTARGFWLLLVYGTGLCTAFVLVGGGIAAAAGMVKKRIDRPHRIVIACALILALLGVMAVTGLMVHYKSLLLSFFV